MRYSLAVTNAPELWSTSASSESDVLISSSKDRSTSMRWISSYFIALMRRKVSELDVERLCDWLFECIASRGIADKGMWMYHPNQLCTCHVLGVSSWSTSIQEVDPHRPHQLVWRVCQVGTGGQDNLLQGQPSAALAAPERHQINRMVINF